jgi:CheY-like chemotaxis protein
LHKGILELKSDLGKGSEFFFTIGYELGEGRAAEKEEIAEVSLSKVLHILLAEDNEFNQIVAVDTLEALFPGIVVDVAENGIIAIEKLKAKMYDLVLMDIQMPEMDGMEATKLIRQSLPEPQKSIKICAMTASVTKQEVDEFFRSGIDDVVAKPFEPQELKQKILAILKGT